MIRRSITLDDYVNIEVNKYRGGLLTNFGLELDYTTVLNMFAEIGIKKMYESHLPNDPIIFGAMSKYSNYSGLETEAKLDQIQDQLVKEIPAMMARLRQK